MAEIPDSTQISLIKSAPPTCPRTLAGPDRRRRLIRAHYASLDGVLPDGEVLELAACATAARTHGGDSRSTVPATATTRTPTYPAGTAPAPQKTPSTPPAGSTSAIPQPGPDTPDELTGVTTNASLLPAGPRGPFPSR